MPQGYRFLALAAAILITACVAPPAPPVDGRSFEDVRRVVAAFDDVGGEYGLAVQDGEVVDAGKLRVFDKLLRDAALFAQHLTAVDRADVARVAGLVAARRPAAEVAAEARRAREAMLARRRLILAPAAPPSRARAEQLWRELCAGCHGDTGVGDGFQGLYLEPEPKNFQDPEIMVELAPSRAFSRITDGLPGTDMPSWGLASTSERWGLAALVFSFRHDEQQVLRGRALAPLVGAVGTFATLSDGADAALLAELAGRGLPEPAREDVLAYLRREVAFAPIGGRLAAIRTAVADGHRAYLERRWPDAAAAFRDARDRARGAVALTATRDPALAVRLAEALARLDTAARAGALESQLTFELVRAQALLDRAERRLAAPSLAGGVRRAVEPALLVALAAGFLLGSGAVARRRRAVGLAPGVRLGLGLGLATLAGLPLARTAAALAAHDRGAAVAAAALAAVALALVALVGGVLAARRPSRRLGAVLAAAAGAAAAGDLAWQWWQRRGSTDELWQLPHVDVLGLHPTTTGLVAATLGALALAGLSLAVRWRPPAPDRRG